MKPVYTVPPSQPLSIELFFPSDFHVQFSKLVLKINKVVKENVINCVLRYDGKVIVNETIWGVNVHMDVVLMPVKSLYRFHFQ